MRSYLTALALLFAVLAYASPVARAGDCCHATASTGTQSATVLELDGEATATQATCSSEEDAAGGCCGDLCDCDEDCGCTDLDVSGAHALLTAERGPVVHATLVAAVTWTVRTPAKRDRVAPKGADPPDRRKSGLIVDARLIPLRD